MTRLSRQSRRSVAILSAAVGVLAGLSCNDGTTPIAAFGTAASMLIVSGDVQQAAVGTELPAAVVVRVVDSAGRAVSGQIVVYRVVAGGGTVFAGTGQTNTSGESRERWTLGTVATDSQRLEARAVDATTGAALVFAVFKATALPASASKFKKASADSFQAPSGTPVSSPPSVKVVDQYDNPVAGSVVTFSVTAGGGSLTGGVQTTSASGTATVGRWTMGSTLGTNTLSASSPGLLGSPITFTATATQRQLALTTSAAGAVNGTPFLTQPVVAIRDAGGNTLTGDSTSVVTMTTSATVVGTASATAVGGIARFTGVGVTGTAGASYTLTFSSPGMLSATQTVVPADYETFALGASQEWFNTTEGAKGAGTLSTQARSYSASWNNANFRFYSSMYDGAGVLIGANDTAASPLNWTRNGAPWQNDPTSAGRTNVQWFWSGGADESGGVRGGFYGSLRRANELLFYIRVNHVVIRNAADTKRAETFAQLMQGAALSGIALNYDKGFYVDENTPAYDSVSFAPLAYVSRRVLRDSAVAKLKAAVALANANSFTTVPTWTGGYSYSSLQIRQIANTMVALTLANYPRDASEAAGVDWAQVAAAASSGIAADFVFKSDGCSTFCLEVLAWFNLIDTGRLSTRVARLLDPTTQKDPYPLNIGNPQPNSADKRLGNGSFGDASLVAGFGTTPKTLAGGTDFAWSTAAIFRPDRGYYHQSNLAHIRYDATGIQSPTGVYGYNGDAPALTVAQNDLTLAEAKLRTGDIAGAVTLINKTRVTRGNLPAATTGLTIGGPTDGPCTSTGKLAVDLVTACTIYSMMLYEKEVELLGVGAQPYYEQRRLPLVTAPRLMIQGLIPGTPREMPVPWFVLQARAEGLYTWGGTGLPNSSPP